MDEWLFYLRKMRERGKNLKRRGRWKSRIYRLAYDKPGVNQKALRLKRSLEEVKRILGQPDKRKKQCKTHSSSRS